jgi:hypothetical protein
MLRKIVRLVPLLLCSVTVPAFAQAFIPSSQVQTVKREAEAVSLLGSMMATTGWTRFAPPSMTATGTVTADGKTEPVSIVAGTGYFRLERPASNVVVVTRGSHGMLLAGSERKALRTAEPFSIQSWMFPFYTDLRNWADPVVSIESASNKQGQTSLFKVVKLAFPSSDSGKVVAGQPPRHSLSVSIASNTGLPVKFQVHRSSQEREDAGVEVDAILGDFRVLNGLLVPFRYEERVSDQTLYIIQLEKVSFGGPLAESRLGLN